jgi:hypothetical protein
MLGFIPYRLLASNNVAPNRSNRRQGTAISPQPSGARGNRPARPSSVSERAGSSWPLVGSCWPLGVTLRQAQVESNHGDRNRQERGPRDRSRVHPSSPGRLHVGVAQGGVAPHELAVRTNRSPPKAAPVLADFRRVTPRCDYGTASCAQESRRKTDFSYNVKVLLKMWSTAG